MLPREAVAASLLDVSKASLGRACSNFHYWNLSLAMAGGLEVEAL